MKATVAQVLDGGLSVIVDEVRIFIPASLVSDSYEKDLAKYLGQEIEFVITVTDEIEKKRDLAPKTSEIISNKIYVDYAVYAKLKGKIKM